MQYCGSSLNRNTCSCSATGPKITQAKVVEMNNCTSDFVVNTQGDTLNLFRARIKNIVFRAMCIVITN